MEVTRATLERIERLNPELNAYVSVLAESAMAAAQAAETQLRAEIDLGPMHGIPVSVKDIIRVKGSRTGAASKILNNAPLDDEDSTAVRRLRAAGAIVLGKVNLHEFALGDPDPGGSFGFVQNPRKMGYQSGSSSSGSGSATAAGLGVVSLGTDTGGSIRHPASVCGVVGLKPTYGLVPVRGVIPLSPGLDHVGPLGRSVADVAASLATIAGWDAEDPYSLREHADDYMSALRTDVRGLRLGLPTNEVFRFGFREALDLIDNARDILIESGLQPVEFALERVTEVVDAVRQVLLPTQLWPYHEQFADQEADYGAGFRERALAGKQISAPEYLRAKGIQAAARREWQLLFDRMDVVLLPANLGGTIPHGSATIEVDGRSLPLRAITAPFNPISNATGFPSLVVPVGMTREGLPIAIQLVGPPLSERRLLAVGHWLEQALGDPVAKWGIDLRR
ncbi:amidase [Agaricicola taiwanensis]|uniref:amidase n=1 Tax=Agaricicola taiwanensis TaxID=591372 RepID=UPI00166500F7|nr:amidase [Agaricicola taiwanensis]